MPITNVGSGSSQVPRVTYTKGESRMNDDDLTASASPKSRITKVMTVGLTNI